MLEEYCVKITHCVVFQMQYALPSVQIRLVITQRIWMYISAALFSIMTHILLRNEQFFPQYVAKDLIKYME
jgi:hypothetical protein